MIRSRDAKTFTLAQTNKNAAPRERSARAQAVARVASLNFTMLKRKLEVVGGWSANALAESEHLYRRFLALKMMYPEKVLNPTPLIDEFWHAHILDTEAYTADCQRLFGRYVHHYPYVELIDDVLALAIGEAVKEETRKLFQKHFHIDLQFSRPDNPRRSYRSRSQE